MVTRLVAQGYLVAQELLSAQIVMAHWPLMGLVATEWPVEAWTDDIHFLGKGGSVPDSLLSYSLYL